MAAIVTRLIDKVFMAIL